MKIALLSTYSNLTADGTNHKSIEALWLRELMKQSGADEVHLIGTKNRNTEKVDGYVDWSEADLSTYDKIFLQLSPANFFGGKWDSRLEWLIKAMTDVNPDRIYILPTDPAIGFTNPAHQLLSRTGDSSWSAYLRAWDTIEQRAHYISPGPDIKKFIGHTPERWVFVPWFQFVHANCLRYYEPVSVQEDDVCYWGAKRGRYREQKIRHFLGDNNLRVRLVGYESDETSIKTRCFKRVKQPELWTHICCCKTSLIIGDEEHEGNVVTFRFWEAIAGGSLPVVDLEFDPECKLELMLGCEVPYVSTSGDILEICKTDTKKQLGELQVAAREYLSKQASQMRLW